MVIEKQDKTNYRTEDSNKNSVFTDKLPPSWYSFVF